MIVHRLPDQITTWRVAFFEGGKYRFARFVPGRFKHCLAFGYSDPCRTWVVYDIAWVCTRIYVLPDGPLGLARLEEWLTGATIVQPCYFLPSRSWAQKLTFRPLALYCVPAIAHLIGVGCGAALTPTAFYRRLIAQGAEIVHGRRHAVSDAGNA